MTGPMLPGTSIPDLGALRQPQRGGARTVQRAGVAPEALRNPNAETVPENPYGHDIIEVTPEEKIRIEVVALAIDQHFAANHTGRTFADDDPRMLDEYERVARDKFGAIGFVVSVTWEAYEADNMPGRAFVPNVTFEARTEYKETDYEEIQSQVVAGYEDGKTGYIREDGSRHEDPLKKNIY